MVIQFWSFEEKSWSYEPFLAYLVAPGDRCIPQMKSHFTRFLIYGTTEFSGWDLSLQSFLHDPPSILLHCVVVIFTAAVAEMWWSIVTAALSSVSAVQGQVTVCLATYGGSPIRYTICSFVIRAWPHRFPSKMIS